MSKFEYYKNKIKSGHSEYEVIKEARKDYNVIPDYSFKDIEYTGIVIPFNLEREYIIKLVEDRKYIEARNHLEEMRRTYRDAEFWNFIEIFEYHLHAAIQAEKNIKLAMEEAKKEFNQHTITIIAVVVGIITLFGTANQIFKVDNFNQGMNTFFSITIAVLATIIVTFAMNGNLKK